jgi:hypothetical protein
MGSHVDTHSLFKQPSAWIPLVLSLAALAFLLVYVAIFGIGYHSDERAPARIFQLIMVAQLPISAYFAVKWLPRCPKQALCILVVQAIAWLSPIAAVIWLESL